MAEMTACSLKISAYSMIMNKQVKNIKVNINHGMYMLTYRGFIIFQECHH